ncbi:pollen-specific leucine-rich repeat extensin-like protein 4 [Iris pallida]|uniref:Pollen-specific leucine-rich repeat extensin-like protein 4 n=1 Tax=Iris pallida TaxID=29817 RepID=A0AAX6G229_IRIPA|nr:pollen-specific leucine-rich repeat extensin-like protein 4 [Iris pallida]
MLSFSPSGARLPSRSPRWRATATVMLCPALWTS